MRKFCPRCEMPKIGSSMWELVDWFKRVGRQEALKEVREQLCKSGASEVVMAAINHVIVEEEKRRGRN